jgi:phosphohistidine swiveling domain-containing protein
MLGAGIPLDETYERGGEDEDGAQPLAARVRSASFDAKSKITAEWTGVEFSILSKGKATWVGGKVVHPKKNQTVEAGSVAVVPNAGPDYYHAMVSACRPGEWHREGLLICETGGKLAHLAVVGREQKCTVLMVPDALKKYRPGDTIFVDFETMKITTSVY